MKPLFGPDSSQVRFLTWCTFIALLLFCCSTVLAATEVQHLEPVYTFVTIIPTASPTAKTVTCTAPAECLSRAGAIEKWGEDGFVMAADLPCLNANGIAEYCFKPKTSATTPTLGIPIRTLIPETLEPGLNQIFCSETSGTLCADECVNTSSDMNNCGACGAKCSVIQYCSQGQCRDVPRINNVNGNSNVNSIRCAVLGRSSCGGSCIDTQTDHNNCGACGAMCSFIQYCSQGQCRNFARVNASLINRCVLLGVDTQTDPDNCGACGTQCPPQMTCSQGQCISLCGRATSLQSFSWENWQGKNWLTSTKDQGQCASCWAFAAVSATESNRNIESGQQENLDLSEQSLVSGCNGNNGDCKGGNTEGALSVIASIGIPAESVLPYQSGNCAYEDSNNHVQCDSGIANPSTGHCSKPNYCPALNNNIWYDIETYQQEAKSNPVSAADEFDTVKNALLCKGPLDVCSAHWWHCITLVGWNGYSNDPNGYWIIKNSWGTGWDTNGYGDIPYGNPWSTDKSDYGDLALDAYSVHGAGAYATQ